MNKYKNISDERMIKACEFITKNGINSVNTQYEWCDAIGYDARNISHIKTGKQSFTPDHIRNCCLKFNVSANFIFGLSTQLFRTTGKETPVQRIESALQELKLQSKTKSLKK